MPQFVLCSLRHSLGSALLSEPMFKTIKGLFRSTGVDLVVPIARGIIRSGMLTHVLETRKGTVHIWSP